MSDCTAWKMDGELGNAAVGEAATPVGRMPVFGRASLQCSDNLGIERPMMGTHTRASPPAAGESLRVAYDDVLRFRQGAIHDDVLCFQAW